MLLHRFGSTRHRLHLLFSALAKAPDGIQSTGLDGTAGPSRSWRRMSAKRSFSRVASSSRRA